MENKSILIIGGTGSLGNELINFLYKKNNLIIFSRDEEKQWEVKNKYENANLKFVVGDIRDYDSIYSTLKQYKPEVVINAAALKQIVTCEYFPHQSIKTNILGIQNLVDAVIMDGKVNTVIGISTDKACKPVSVYGMCKAIQERIYIEANLRSSYPRFICVRYGNVLASRGSVIPLFKEQINKGNSITITLPTMTRFLLTLQQSVQLIMNAYKYALPGDTWIPKAVSAKVIDIATAMIGKKNIPIKQIGIRPGEKIDEVLISEEEAFRTVLYKDYFVIEPTFPELTKKHKRKGKAAKVKFKEYSSKDDILSLDAVKELLKKNNFISQ